MRFNEKEVALLSKRQGQFEGRLHYRAPPGTFRDTGFRERYFRLVNNFLFYFRISEVGQIDFKQPVGIIVLENYSVRVETDSELSFAFVILFLDEPDKRHIFTARSDSDANQWVNTIRQSSYQHWKEKLLSMRSNIKALQEAKNDIKKVRENVDLIEFSDTIKIKTSSPSIRRNPFLPPSPKPPSRSNSKHSTGINQKVTNKHNDNPPSTSTSSSTSSSNNNNDLIKW